MIRKNGVIAVLVTALVLVVFSLFFMNPLLKMALIASLEPVVKAKVEVGALKLDIGKQTITIKEMKVADRNREFSNLFEFDKAEFGVNLEAALMKKVVIKQALITGFRTGTQRKTSGFLSAAKLRKIEKNEKNSPLNKVMASVKEKAGNEIKKLPAAKMADSVKSIDKEAIKKMASPEQLESYRLIREALPAAEEKKKTALASLEGAKINEKTAAIKKAAEELRSVKISGAQDAAKAQEALAKLETIRKEAQDAQEALNKAKRDSQEFYDYSSSMTGRINEARQRDTDNIMKKLDIGAVSGDEIIKALIGPVWYEKVTGTLALLHAAEKYIPAGVKKKKNKTMEQKRLKGRDIIFPGGRGYPGLLVEKLEFTTGKSGEPGIFTGKAENITTEQFMTGVPTTFNIGSSGAGALRLSGKIDHIDEIDDTLTVTMAGMSPKQGGVGPVDAGNITMIPGASDYRATAYNRGGIISMNADVGLRQIEFSAKDKNDIVLTALSGIDEINANIRLAGKEGGFDMSITTDAADRITKNINKVYGEKLANARKQINEEIGKAIAGENSNLSKVLSGGNREIEGKLAVYEKQLKDSMASIDKAKAEITKKASAGAQDAGKKLLKGILGK